MHLTWRLAWVGIAGICACTVREPDLNGDGSTGPAPPTDGTTSTALSPSGEAASGSSSGPASTSSPGTTGDPTTGEPVPTTGDPAGSGSESSSGSGGPADCDLDACIAKCSVVTDTGRYGDCYAGSEDWEPWDCPTVELCDPIFTVPFGPGLPGIVPDMEFQEAVACLLTAVEVGEPGRIDYSIDDLEATRWGTVHVVGPGRVMLDMYAGEHCGDGGSYSTRPLRTHVMGVSLAPLEGCVGLATLDTDTVSVFNCAFGEWPASASSPSELPWLDGDCLRDAPACP